MKKFLAIACLLFATAGQANSIADWFAVQNGSFTVMGGVTQYERAPDGQWYQAPFEHTTNMAPKAWGLRYDTARLGRFSFGAGYVDLGEVTSYARATRRDMLTAGDGGYDPAIRGCSGPCGEFGHWHGKGKVEGVFASASVHAGQFAFEGGAFAYYPTWEVKITPTSSTTAFGPFTAKHKSDWQIGPLFGVRYTQGPWSVRWNVWAAEAQGDAYPALYERTAQTLMAGYTF